jgi:hypothetical protein
MFRLLSVFPVVALLLSVAPASAAPRSGDKAEGPALIGQAKGLNELLEMTKVLVKNVAGEDLFKAFEKEALPNLDPSKLPGIDPKRPFGLYGTIDADLAKCRVVVLVPVTGEKTFLDMLEQFDIPVNKGKDPGTFEFVTPPDVPFPVVGRIHKDYAYIAFGGADVLEPKLLLDPKDVINDKEKAVAYLALRLDRVPAEVKKNVVGMIRQRTEQLPDAIEDPDLKAAAVAARNLGYRWLRMLAEETKEVALRLDADTKGGDVSLEFVLEPSAKSSLAETIAQRKPSRNAFASIAGPDTIYKQFMSGPLFADEAKEAWTRLIEYGEKEIGKKPAGPETALFTAILKSLKATIATGDMDLALALRGPNKDGFYNAVAAIHCQETGQLVKAVQEAVKGLGQAAGYVKWDAGRVAGLSYHELDLASEAEDTAKGLFGPTGNKGYFAVGKNAIYAAYGPDGLALLKEAIEAKPGPAAVYEAWSDPKKMKDFMAKVFKPGDPNGRALGGAFGIGASESLALGGSSVTIDGGDRLKIKFKLNVGAFLMMGFGRMAGAAQPPAPAPAAVAPPPLPLPAVQK